MCAFRAERCFWSKDEAYVEQVSQSGFFIIHDGRSRSLPDSGEVPERGLSDF